MKNVGRPFVGDGKKFLHFHFASLFAYEFIIQLFSSLLSLAYCVEKILFFHFSGILNKHKARENEMKKKKRKGKLGDNHQHTHTDRDKKREPKRWEKNVVATLFTNVLCTERGLN